MKNTPKEFKDIIDAILPSIIGYLENNMSGTGKVLKQKPASDLAKEMNVEYWIKNGGIQPKSAKDFLQTYLANSQRLHHPRYIGHQVSATHLASGVADMIHGAINNPMGIYEMGPSAAVIEGVIVNWMLSKAGWFAGSLTDFNKLEGKGSGVLTHGGSLANLTAMLAARAVCDPLAWENGNSNDLVVLGSDVAHYSIARSISIMGMGKKSLASVGTDNNEVLIPDELPKVLRRVKEEGKRVMAVVANACATTTGLYDPVEEIGHFCNENGLWYHVDGAHGASALVSDKYKRYIEKLEHADSMIWDTHKMLRTTTICAAVLFKNPDHLGVAFKQKGSYLFHDKEQIGFDLMPYTVECTKAGIATKLFWVLAAEGEQGLANYYDRQTDLTIDIYRLITEHLDFECPYIPESNIICFRYKNGPSDNHFQLKLRNELIKRGKFYISSSEMKGIRYLRMTVINALTKLNDIEELLKEIVSIADELISLE